MTDSVKLMPETTNQIIARVIREMASEGWNITAEHTIACCRVVNAIERATRPTPAVDDHIHRSGEMVRALEEMQDALDGNEFSALYWLQDHKETIRVALSAREGE